MIGKPECRDIRGMSSRALASYLGRDVWVCTTRDPSLRNLGAFRWKKGEMAETQFRQNLVRIVDVLKGG